MSGSILKKYSAASDGSGRRFSIKPKHAPESLNHISPTHAAIAEKRTIYPSSVMSAADAPRVLVSGVNSIKLGRIVKKGDWAGMPIYQLTLEERAACPPTCNNRVTCYGNSMPFARRHKADDALLPALRSELAELNAKHRRGFVVRLHVLGDFYSVEYADAWLEFLDDFQGLHVFGYTAWSRDSDVGQILAVASRINWARFAIRFSSDDPTPGGATTIWRTPEAAVVAEGIVCPAQTDASACCATCGMCWAKAAKDKTIVFIGHGKVGGRRKAA